MPRMAAGSSAEGIPHHITQRGNARQECLRRGRGSAILSEALAQIRVDTGLGIWAWCLMTNHVHLLAVAN